MPGTQIKTRFMSVTVTLTQRWRALASLLLLGLCTAFTTAAARTVPDNLMSTHSIAHGKVGGSGIQGQVLLSGTHHLPRNCVGVPQPC